MIFTQRFLERIVQLIGRNVLSLFQVKFHQFVVDFHDLIDYLGMGRFNGREIGIRAVGFEESV